MREIMLFETKEIEDFAIEELKVFKKHLKGFNFCEWNEGSIPVKYYELDILHLCMYFLSVDNENYNYNNEEEYIEKFKKLTYRENSKVYAELFVIYKFMINFNITEMIVMD